MERRILSIDEFINEQKINEARQPKFWDSMFTMQAIDAYLKNEFDIDDPKSIAEWEKEKNGGHVPNPPFNTEELVKYAISVGKKPNGETLKSKK